MTDRIVVIRPTRNRMTIGLVGTTYRPIVGGMETYISRLARGFVEAGNEVVVATRFVERRPLDSRALYVSSERLRFYNEDGVRIAIISPPNWLRFAFPLLYRMHFYDVTSRLAREVAVRAFCPALRCVFKGCDVIHHSGTGQEMLGYAAARVAAEMGVPFVVTPHTHAGAWGDGVGDFQLYGRADKTIALTEDERSRLVGGGLKEGSVFVVKHGSSSTSAASGRRFRTKHGVDGPMVFYLGRKTKAKGYQLLLDAAPEVWKRCPEAMFVLAGPLGTNDEFRKDVLSDPRILDLDVLTDAERDDAYAASDVVCVPSAHEAFGLVYVEAWAFSKPVVALRIPTLVEIVEGARGGLLTDHTPEAVADALSTLLADPGLRNELGRAGNDTASRRTWEAVARDTLGVYQQAIEENT